MKWLNVTGFCHLGFETEQGNWIFFSFHYHNILNDLKAQSNFLFSATEGSSSQGVKEAITE
jgi:hypothetical protein